MRSVSISDILVLMEDIIQDFVIRYTSEDGLCRLDLEDDQPGFPPATERTVRNQNGIMFYAETILSLYIKGIDVMPFRMSAMRTLDKLFIPGTGCTDRRPYDKSLVDSHDNMLGIVVLCQLLDLDLYIERLCEWGRLHGWCFNNLDPERFDIRGLRQGSDIAIYQLANGEKPHLINLLWLWGGLFFTDDLRLYKLRFESVKLSNKSYKNGWLTEMIMSLGYLLKGGDKQFVTHIESYFKDHNHPIRRLWQRS